MALKRVEVAQARGTQDRRPELETLGLEDRVVIVSGRLVGIEDIPQGLDAEAACEMVVKGGDRSAEESRIVGTAEILGQEAAPGDLEIEPAHRRRSISQPRGETPRAARRRELLAHVGNPHGPGVYGGQRPGTPARGSIALIRPQTSKEVG